MKAEFIELANFPKEIRWLGDEVLRQKAEPVTSQEIASGKARKIVQQLESVLKEIQELGRGVAIAAPQIGISKAVTVVYWKEKFTAFINPVITRFSDKKNTFPEGCLSSLPLVAETVRPAEIDVQYVDLSGEAHQEHCEGKKARILQHEIDHLNGILFVDRADLTKSRFVPDFEEYKKTAQLTDLSPDG